MNNAADANTKENAGEKHDRLRAIRLLALDVDGTLTDGGVYYDDAGSETKRFHIHDGLGMVLAQMAGLRIIWITGRTSSIVQKRAGELKIGLVLQGVRDKGAALQDAAQQMGFALSECAFMGDDLNDLPAFDAASVCFAPANASPDVLVRADFVMPRSGGNGAVRDAIDLILRARGDYDATVSAYAAALRLPSAKTPTQ